MTLSRALWLVALAVAMQITGCAAPSLVTGTTAASVASWRGRLAIRVEPRQAQAAAQSFSAGFELAGNAQAGELTLYTPLGTTAAALSWSARTAVMRNAEGSQNFESLDALIKQALGTEIPVAALFAWLAGDNMSAAGWSADLSRYAEGSILARRVQPESETEIRLLLEK